MEIQHQRDRYDTSHERITKRQLGEIEGETDGGTAISSDPTSSSSSSMPLPLMQPPTRVSDISTDSNIRSVVPSSLVPPSLSSMPALVPALCVPTAATIESPSLQLQPQLQPTQAAPPATPTGEANHTQNDTNIASHTNTTAAPSVQPAASSANIATPSNLQPNSLVNPPSALITPNMTARDRMAARLAAAKQGTFALSRAAYDAAIRSGASPSSAQDAADAAVRAHEVAAGRPPPPSRSVSSPEEEANSNIQSPPALRPTLRTSMSENGLDRYPSKTSSSSSSYRPAPSESRDIPQQPNAVSVELQKTTRAPHLPGRTEEEWAVRDAQFMDALCYGVASAQGERAYMEDEHRIVPHFEKLVRLCHPPPPPATQAAIAAAASPATPAAASASSSSSSSSSPPRGNQAFFGVYDGHGGREAAEFVRDHLHLNIAKRIGASTDPQPDLGEAMKLGAADTESELLEASLGRESTAGAVVAFTIFNGMQVYVAHAGDSRAVLCRDGVAMDLTQDHKPGLESEQDRVAALGGFISDGCVNGEIAVSRALGDVNLTTGQKMLGLSGDVALSKFYLNDEDEFVIIACDGLFDVMNSAAAVSYARHQLAQHNDIQRCATELVQQALRQQSTDNISVIVIGFMRTSPDGEPLIVPRDKPRLGGHRAARVVVPPRPERLHLNRGGLSKLMAALEIPERVASSNGSESSQNGSEEEEEEEGEEAADDEDAASD